MVIVRRNCWVRWVFEWLSSRDFIGFENGAVVLDKGCVCLEGTQAMAIIESTLAVHCCEPISSL